MIKGLIPKKEHTVESAKQAMATWETETIRAYVTLIGGTSKTDMIERTAAFEILEARSKSRAA